ncbi:hypothetical protein [Spiroplasma endosymbiont of Othius punctulatus]|uniref:hypothetical protein n=1 Tax=Spiroplasma endosymbiont of Othius punctulatus TaxID=3066289 RepID=UPI0030CF5A22
MKWKTIIKCVLLIFIPLALALGIYVTSFENVFGERHIKREIDIKDDDTDDDEVDRVIKFKIDYGINVTNTKIIPPTEVEYQESFVTSNDVVEFYSEYNIEKNFYFNKREILDSEKDEIVIKLIPLKVEDVKLLNRFNHKEVNTNYFLNAGLSLEESVKLETLCWDFNFKDIDAIKYEMFESLDLSYRKVFLDYAIEKMIY